MIVEIERDGKKFLTGIHFNQTRNGLVVNSVRGLFNKSNAEWLNWVTQGKLLWVDKGKIQALIGKQRTNLADVTYLDLDSVTKVVNNFENPTPGGRKSSLLSSDFGISAWNDTVSGQSTVGMALGHQQSERCMSSVQRLDASREANVREISARFNAELERQIAGTLPLGHVYQLGRPSEPLLSAGFPDLPIELSASHLAGKARDVNHPFALGDVRGLVDALQHPIAVFLYGDRSKSQNVIVEIERDGKKFLTGIHFNQTRNGLEVNSVRGLFNKDNAEWLNWVTQGKLLWVDKGKIQALIGKQQINLADVTYLDLDSVAKVVNLFENPTLGGGKSLGFLRQGDQAVEEGVDEREGVDEGRSDDEEETETIEEVRPRGRGR